MLGRKAQLGLGASHIKGLGTLVGKAGKAGSGQGHRGIHQCGANLAGGRHKVAKAGQLATANGVDPRRQSRGIERSHIGCRHIASINEVITPRPQQQRVGHRHTAIDGALAQQGGQQAAGH